MIQIKWAIGVFDEKGSEYVCRADKGYYFSEIVNGDTLVWHKPTKGVVENTQFIWLPITIPVAQYE